MEENVDETQEVGEAAVRTDESHDTEAGANADDTTSFASLDSMLQPEPAEECKPELQVGQTLHDLSS
jgi:hypothetical protein